jgi:hypothetical protein
MRDFLFVLLLATGVAFADDAPKVKRADGAAGAQEKSKEEAQASTKEDPNAREDSNLGMSILGNQEAPKALVIVPWKRSEIGTALGVSTMLDDSRLPVDKEVFIRMLRYYEIRSETTRRDGAPAAGRETAPTEGSAAQPATAAHRRKS